MSYIPRKKKISPSKSALATSQSTQQLPPRQVPSTPESQSYSPQQQHQLQPDHPWSVLRPTFRRRGVLPFTSPSPFPRYSYILSTTAAGELLFFGGYAHRSLHTDLYVFSTRDLSAALLQTSGEVPGPRFRPAAVLMNSVLLIWGGVTKFDDQGEPKGPYDDSLYLLSLVSQVWTRVVVNGPRPVGRCGHAMTMIGSKLFIFGGETGRGCSNDMWAFDLNSLKSIPVWNSYDPTPGDKKPPPRIGHVLVSTGDRIILFGGTNGQCDYNDTWSFDISTRKWTELQCTGSIPPPRHSHAAALIDDVMYVFGGRDDRRVLGDLIAFKLSTQQWFTFQKKGSSPSGRSGHAMVSNGTRLFVLGGKLAAGAQADETPRIHVLETKLIENPNPDAVKPSEKTTQPALQSSAGHSTQQQPQYPTSSSSDAYTVHNAPPFQNSTPEELGHPASPQITCERNPSLNDLPLHPTSMNGKTRRVPEKDDNGEGSAEYLLGASSEGEVARLECERVVELERQMSAMLAARTEQDQRLAQLIEELALKSALLERAEANAAEATKSAGLEPRELADRLLAQTSLVEHKDADLMKMQVKLDELVASRDQHVRALEQAQSALQKATSRAADADGYETELVEVRAELEARKSELEAREPELEAIRLRLTNAEIGWAKSKTEADTLRASNTAGLVSTDEERITRRLLERMEAEMVSLRWSEKSLEAMETRNEG